MQIGKRLHLQRIQVPGPSSLVSVKSPSYFEQERNQHRLKGKGCTDKSNLRCTRNGRYLEYSMSLHQLARHKPNQLLRSILGSIGKLHPVSNGYCRRSLRSFKTLAICAIGTRRFKLFKATPSSLLPTVMNRPLIGQLVES